MEAKDLRIGNWVLENDYKETQVISINEDCVLTKSAGKQTITPIPLTEEWLLRFGFYKPAYSWIGDKFHLSEWDDYPLNWCVAFNKNNAILVDKLRYVHQLQNLYFALMGKDLEIKTT